MIHDPERLSIEQQVLAQCMDGGHLYCLNILVPDNFSREFHRRLFTCISGMVDQPVDIITVSRAYTLRYQEMKAPEITDIYHRIIHRGSHYYPLLLLEIDIRSKFATLLDGYREASVSESDFESAAIWKQCLEHISNPANDVFKAVDDIYKFLQQYKPEEISEYADMMALIPKRIANIRKVSAHHQLIENLKNNNAFHGRRGDLLNTVSDILIHLTISDKVHPDIENYLNHIKHQLL